VNDGAEAVAGQFSTTRWSVVLAAGQAVSPESAAALEKLCRAYWQPIYVFARRRGRNDADAKDLTQQFFARLLERQDFAGLDPSRGKFRTFLLTAFTHFLANDYDRATALKRGGGKMILSLDELSFEELDWVAATDHSSPATVFDLRWAQAILQAALQQLKLEMAGAGKECQFEELKPFLTVNADAGEYAAAAQRLNVEAGSVPVLVHRLRQRYRELVRAEVTQTVRSPAELDEEMRHLFTVLNQ
jgi:RNA polymerase sigma-70 factor (ECF subfamily)